MSLSSKIAKNTTYLSVSSLLQKLLSFWWFAQVAHYLGADLFGKYQFALNYTSIFVIIMNFGLVPVLTREGARQDKNLQDQLNSVFTLKTVLTVVSLVVMFTTFHILNVFKPQSFYTVELVYLAGGVIILDTFRSIFLAVLRARQAMQYEAIGQLLYQGVVVGLGLAAMSLHFQGLGMVWAISAASAVYLVYALVITLRKTGLWPHWSWQNKVIWTLLKIAAPFALADVFFKLSGSLDTVMLQYWAGERFVAWYNIALKLTVTLTVIPGAFATAFFPAMSRAYLESTDKLKAIFERSMQALLVISFPIATGTLVLANDIIATVFPDFPAATIALQIFMSGVVFLFINYPIGNLLNAANKQLLNTTNMGIALGVNVILNVLLIGPYNYVGATISSVATAVVIVLLGLPHVYQIIHFNIWWLVKKVLQTGCSATLMALALYYIHPLLVQHFSGKIIILISLGISALLYLPALLLTQAVSWQDSKLFVKAIRDRSF